jgi:hypothetical protein
MGCVTYLDSAMNEQKTGNEEAGMIRMVEAADAKKIKEVYVNAVSLC